MDGQKSIRILIADDHSVVRMGLAALLSAEDDLAVAGYAKNGREAVARTLELHPDVVIMDLEMPQTDGVAATAEIAAQAPRTRVLILTSFATTDRLAQAVKAGAAGTILKSADDAEVIAAIRAVAGGKTYLSSDVQRLFREDPPVPRLSPRQGEILDSITRGLTNADISRQLGISLVMVKKHVTALFQKIGAANRAEATAIASRKHLVKD